MIIAMLPSIYAICLIYRKSKKVCKAVLLQNHLKSCMNVLVNYFTISIRKTIERYKSLF